MSDKCFCHLNGYEVKDAKARNDIATLDSVASKISEDVTVLENRMNTFTALPEGSTTADSELLDIRVGADGTVYSSAGESVRTQISNLTSDDECYSMAAEEMQQETSDGYSNLLQLDYVLGSVNGSTGEFNTIQGGIRTSDFITVSEPTTIYFKKSECVKDVVIFIYDENSNFLTSVYNKEVYTLSTNRKYIITFYQTNFGQKLIYSLKAFPKVVRIYQNYEPKSLITDEISYNDYFYKKLNEDNADGYSENVLFEWELGGFNNNTGVLANAVGSIRTGYLTFSEDTTLYFSVDSLIKEIWIGLFDIETSEYKTCSYFNMNSRYTFSPNYKYIICLLSENFAQPLPTTVEHFSMMFRTYKEFSPEDKILKECAINSCFGAFRKFGVIGDSLSVGWTNQNRQRNVAYSWVQYLARYCNNSALNFGVSGITVEGWLSHQLCYHELIKDGNKCQAYVLGIGTNGTETIGTASDIDLEDMSNNANTFYGNYAKIIQTIFSVNPLAKVFVFTIPFPRINNAKNNAIREIATMFDDVFLVDLAGEYNHYFASDYITKFATQGHFSAPGYSNIAKLNLMLLSKTMLDNAESFTDVDTIPYGNGGIIY